MSDEYQNRANQSPANPGSTGEDAKPDIAPSVSRELLPLPGLAAIALYMFVLAGVTILGVVGGQFRPIYLAFSAFFITAALGLLRLMRWAWALALGAVVLLVALFTWKFTTSHEVPFLVQGLLNLVCFLYLIRTEVRSKLK